MRQDAERWRVTCLAVVAGLVMAAAAPATHGPIVAPGCGSSAGSACTVVKAADLASWLTVSANSLPPSAPWSGIGNIVKLKHVHIAGTLDLRGSKLVRGLQIDGADCQIDDLDLRDAQANLPIDIGCLITGTARFDGFTSTASLGLKGAALGAGTLELYDISLGGSLDVSKLVAGTLDLADSRVSGQTWIGGTRLTGALQLEGMTASGDMRLDGLIASSVSAEDMRVGGTLSAAGIRTQAISIAGARIRRIVLDGGQIGCRTDGACATLALQPAGDGLNAANVEIGQNVSARGMAARRIDLGGAAITGDLDLTGAKFGSLEAGNVHIGGQVDMGLVQAGTVNFAGALVHGDLDLASATFAFKPRIVRTTVEGSVDLRGTRAPGVDLNGSTIGAELQLWPVVTDSTAVLSLADVKVGAISEPRATAPPRGRDKRHAAAPGSPDHCHVVPNVELTGLVYSRLSGFDTANSDLRSRKPLWLACMLGRQHDTVFAMQPYQQLASVLRASGDSDAANSILWYGRWRDLKDSLEQRNLFDAGRSLLLYVTIGWGIGTGYIHALYCAIAITCFGAWVLYRGRMLAKPDIWAGQQRLLLQWCLTASVAQLLPIPISGDYKDYFDKVAPGELAHWRQFYFVVHSIIGFFIAGCLAAGITGFTQAAS